MKKEENNKRNLPSSNDTGYDTPEKKPKIVYETANFAPNRNISEDMQEAVNGSLQAFLARGGDINERDNSNNTILHRLIRNYTDKDTSPADKIIIIAKIIELISMGANLNLTNHSRDNTRAQSVKQLLIREGLLNKAQASETNQEIAKILTHNNYGIYGELSEDLSHLADFPHINDYIINPSNEYFATVNAALKLPTDLIQEIFSYLGGYVSNLYTQNTQAQIYRVIPEIGDGNCFFRAVARQVDSTHEEVRDMVVSYMTENIVNFNVAGVLSQYAIAHNQALSQEDIDNRSPQYTNLLSDYILEMAQHGTWANQFEIQMVADIFGRRVLVHSLSNGVESTLEIAPRQESSLEPINLQYINNHYNSLVPIYQNMGETTSESTNNISPEISEADSSEAMQSQEQENDFFEIFGMQAVAALSGVVLALFSDNHSMGS